VIETLNDKSPEPEKMLSISIPPSASYNIGGGPLQIILKDDDAPPGGSGTGLKAEYFAKPDFTEPVTSQVDAQIDFKWDKKAPIAKVQPDKYSIRWSGKIEPLYSDTFTFTTPGTPYGTAKLIIDGKTVIAAKAGKSVSRSGTIALKAGKKYDIVLEYTNARDYGSFIRLIWSNPKQFEQAVPKSQLFPSP